MKRAILLCGVLGACFASAQAPDVRVKLDATLSYVTEGAGPTNIRAYSFDGRPSTVAISLRLESGFRAFVSERLERTPGDADPSLLDEYYFEDPGLWRVGKQLLPFGSGRVIRETAFGVRGDTSLIIQGLPIALLACDGGPGLVRGVTARLGSRIGVSVFYGRNLGISAASLSQIRDTDESLGPDHGYQTGVAIDAARRIGKFELRGEFVSLSQGETAQDKDMNLADGTVIFYPGKNLSLSGGYTWTAPDARQYLRFGATVAITRGVQFEPWIRFKNNALRDITLQIRVRL